MKRNDLTGQVFGRLTARRYLGNRKWECVCNCGTVKSVETSNLTLGVIKSCGCLFKELLVARNTSHGLSRSPTYKSWASAKDRCTNSNRPDYLRYGGRGVRMCERWAGSFENFLADMGERPSRQHSLDRIDNDGHYEPGNVRWATKKEQGNNRSTCQPVMAFGESKTIPEWLQDPRCAVPLLTTLRSRIVHLGWDTEMAITTPPSSNCATNINQQLEN
jgi:hypothetical protein